VPPSVSILINNYNNAPWLRACLDSALEQTTAATEIIVYDDGSTDDSVPILRSYGARITFIEGIHDHQLHGYHSQALAIARAFAVSRGTHVYLLDGDDAYHPDHVALYEELWAQHPAAVMIQGPLEVIDQNSQPIGQINEPKRNRTDYLGDIYRYHETDYFYATSALAFHRDFLTAHLPLDFTDASPSPIDIWLSLAASLYGEIRCVARPATYYRVRAGSMSEHYDDRTSHHRMTIDRLRYFNLLAAQRGAPTLSLWRNAAYRRQLLRRLLPKRLGDALATWRYTRQSSPPRSPSAP
jgi:glycosyltransferase involved in cell wall biosynthesis